MISDSTSLTDEQARNRFFPGWQKYDNGSDVRPEVGPRYFANVNNAAAFDQLVRVCPSFVRAEIVHEEAYNHTVVTWWSDGQITYQRNN